jgi:hypothetical protein
MNGFPFGETANPRMPKERLARRRAEKQTGATWAYEPSKVEQQSAGKERSTSY